MISGWQIEVFDSGRWRGVRFTSLCPLGVALRIVDTLKLDDASPRAYRLAHTTGHTIIL